MKDHSEVVLPDPAVSGSGEDVPVVPDDREDWVDVRAGQHDSLVRALERVPNTRSVLIKTVKFISVVRNHRHLDKETACWPRLACLPTLPIYFTACPQPYTHEGLDRKNCISSYFLLFCCERVTSATFHCMWTNSEAQTNQLST